MLRKLIGFACGILSGVLVLNILYMLGMGSIPEQTEESFKQGIIQFDKRLPMQVSDQQVLKSVKLDGNTVVFNHTYSGLNIKEGSDLKDALYNSIIKNCAELKPGLKLGFNYKFVITKVGNDEPIVVRISSQDCDIN